MRAKRSNDSGCTVLNAQTPGFIPTLPVTGDGVMKPGVGSSLRSLGELGLEQRAEAAHAFGDGVLIHRAER